MMNRSDRDDLLQTLLTTKQRIEQIAKTLFLRKVPAVADTLQKVCDELEQTLSEEHAAFYTESLLSLVNVMQGFETQKMPVRDRIESLKLMGDIIDEVSRKLAQETEIKKEIYFLPYKASMWDSLESIWRAAAEDKDHCNAYVMPIPYADRKPDGTAAEWHCERDQFPVDVPVVNWEDVDLEAVHPDVIYIHNPYDGNNIVTSVDSRYYSDKLKQCTDKLIYVPYFVLAEPDWVKDETLSDGQKKENENAISGFVLTPGVLNADEVYVQSENMRQVYIDVLMDATEHKDKEYWGKRIIAFGSPKLEKIKRSKKEDYTLPEKWQRIIAGKKVILYNTSLSATLQNTDKVCGKLRYVFNVFKSQDKCALWWRPHPLMKATLRSMRPEVADEYEQIEKEYIAAGWGIYDDNPDVDRAVVCTDAYYGDCSSVVQLYQKTGKPIMIQSIPLTE